MLRSVCARIIRALRERSRHALRDIERHVGEIIDIRRHHGMRELMREHAVEIDGARARRLAVDVRQVLKR